MFRNISPVPSRADCKKYIKGDGVLSVLQLGGPIADTARTLFTHVRIGLHLVKCENIDEGHVLLRGCDAGISQLTQWIDLAGETLTNLVLRLNDERVDPEECPDTLTALKEKCPALRSLEMESTPAGPFTDAVLAATLG